MPPPTSQAAAPVFGHVPGHILGHVFAQHAWLGPGWARDVRITHQAGSITSVQCNTAAEPGDETCAVLLPGLPNLHSHAFQRAIAGLTERRGPAADSFWTWREAMYRTALRIDPDMLRAIAAQAFAEMLEAGFTRVGEFHYLHHQPDGSFYADRAEMARAVLQAAQTTGIAITLLPVFYAHGGFGPQPAGAQQRRFLNTSASYAQLLDACARAMQSQADAILGVAPHSLRAATLDEIRDVISLAPAAPRHIHIAEQMAEVAACQAAHGTTPIRLLADQIGLDAQWCLVHATHASAEEIALMAGLGAAAGLCPVTEANLGDGIFPYPGFAAQGGRFGIGSDSNVRIDAMEELRLLEYGQRLHLQARNVAARLPGASCGDALFQGALHGGAQALGVALAGLQAGAPADFVALDTQDPGFAAAGPDAWLDCAIFAARRPIDRVWRGGRCVVTGGRHHAQAQIARDFAAVMQRLAP